MKDKQPPSDNEIMEYVKEILEGADLDKITMKMLCTQVFSHYPDFDLMHKRDFIKGIVKSNLDTYPSIDQMNMLVQFLEDNPEIATGGHLRSVQGLQIKHKWQEVTTALNALGGATRNADSWANFWADKKHALERIIAQRNAAASHSDFGAEHLQPLSETDERLILILGGPRYEKGDQEHSNPIVTSTDFGHGGESQQRLANYAEDIIVHKHKIDKYRRQSHSPDNSLQTNESEVEVHEEPTGSTSEVVQTTSQVPTRSTSRAPRSSPRFRVQREQHSQLTAGQLQRLMRLQERRLRAELASSAGWGSLVQAIDRLTDAVMTCGEKIAGVIENRH